MNEWMPMIVESMKNIIGIALCVCVFAILFLLIEWILFEMIKSWVEFHHEIRKSMRIKSKEPLVLTHELAKDISDRCSKIHPK